MTMEQTRVAAHDRPLQIPAVVARAGRAGWLAALAGGVVFGGVTLIIPILLSREDAFGFLAILL